MQTRSGPLRERRVWLAPLIAAICSMVWTRSAGAQILTFEPSRPITTLAGTDRGDDSTPRLSYDGTGTWVVVWRSRDDFGGTIGGDWDIVSSSSVDDGQTWSTPVIVNSNALGDNELDIEPSAAGDGNGIWIVVWESYDSLGNTIGADADILLSVSSDNAASWSPARALSSTASASQLNDRVPRIATDGNGVWIVAWESFESAISFDSDTDLLYSRSTDDGLNWSNPKVLNKPAIFDGTHDTEVEIVTDGLGVWIAAWKRAPTLVGGGPDWDVLYARSVDAGQTWSASAPLNSNAATDAYNDWGPKLAADGRGIWVAVWISNEDIDGRIGTDSDVLFARSVDGGVSWSDPASLVLTSLSDTAADDRATISTDGQGHWAVAWQSRLDRLGNLGGDREILISVSLDEGRSWRTPVALDPDAPFDTGNDRGPSLGTNRRGDWICVWESLDKPGSPTGEDTDIRISTGRLPIAKSKTWRRYGR